MTINRKDIKPYTESVKRIAAARWGPHCKTNDEADRQLLKSVDLSGACLLGLVRRLDIVIEALASEVLDKRINDARHLARRSVERFLEKRPGHGKPPLDLIEYLNDEVSQLLGRDILVLGKLPYAVYWLNIPPKGTDVRRSYDRWMKQKAKQADLEVEDVDP